MSMTQSIAWALYEMISPLRGALQDRRAMSHLLEEMGWSVEIAADQLPIIQEILAVTTLIEEFANLLPTLNTMEAGEIVAEVIPLAQEVFELIDTLADVDGERIASLDEPLNTTAFWVELALDLPEFLLLRWMYQRRHPILFRLMVFFGIVEETGRSVQYDMPLYKLHWEMLSQLFANPIDLLATTYDWGGEFAHQPFLQRLSQLTSALGFSGHLHLPAKTIADQFYAPENEPDTYQLEWIAHDDWLEETNIWLKAGLLLLPIPIPSDAENPSALYLGNILHGKTEVDTPLNDGELKLHITSDAEGTGAVGVVFAPNADPDVQTYLPSVNFEISLQYIPKAPAQTDSASSLTLSGVEGALSITGTPANPVITIRIGTLGDGLVLAVQPGEGDSFIQDFLGETALTSTAEVVLSWSNKSGLSLLTEAGIDLLIPLNLHLFGVLTILSLHLELMLEDGLIAGTAAISASGELGPFTLTVADIGIKMQVEPLNDNTAYVARFGSLGLDLGFKPPSGVGAAFDFLGIVYGGGFMDFDVEKGEYSGMITVQLAVIGITATAIITTQVPGGADGWSLFISINVNLGGIPLGFGFTLEKVGGLIGVNRAIDTEVFQSGIRTGLLDSIMFPDDPIANAPRILSDIAAAFPIATGTFVVGAMLQIGWGAPTLITASVGFVIQLPDVIVLLLGQAETVLPFEALPLVEIHFDVLGIIDIAAGTFSLDAGLRNSQIVGFVLTGQMAMRACFLTAPSFLLAMGGFHPAFTPPESFPTLDRLGISLGVGDWLSISLEAYLALTSNTVQFGAGLYLTARFIGFSIEGGTEINTLIQFSPFQFITQISFFITVSAGSIELLGVELTGRLSGPNPYYIRGQARFKILGLEQEVDIDETIGAATPLDEDDEVPVLPDVITALQEPENWSAVDDGARIGAVLLAEVAEGVVAVHPGGSVQAIQRVAPLDVQLEHYGNSEIDGEDTLDVNDVTSGDDEITWTFAQDWFAPAQFFDLSGDEKLNAPSFEEMKAGLRFGDDEAESGTSADDIYDYEQIIYDPEFSTSSRKLKNTFRPQISTLSGMQAQISPRTGAGTSRPLSSPSANQTYTLKPARYVIVDRKSLTGTDKKMTFAEASQSVGTKQIVVTSGERGTKK